jgi:hypothetical protein
MLCVLFSLHRVQIRYIIIAPKVNVKKDRIPQFLFYALLIHYLFMFLLISMLHYFRIKFIY